MRLVRLHVENFRNLEPATVVWDGGLNLIVGDNGEGKSNLLEAVTVLGNLRPFRRVPWGAVVRRGASWFRLEGEVTGSGGGQLVEQVFELGPPRRRRLRVGGREVDAGEYLLLCPVFAFSGGDDDLVEGPPEGRRAFVDRLAFLLRPAHLPHVRQYRRALQQRNAGLVRGVSDSELEAWESMLAQAAAPLVDNRRLAVSRVRATFGGLYRRLGRPSFPAVEVSYGGDRRGLEDPPTATFTDWYRDRLQERRAADRRLGYTGEGPHRHDLRLEVGGRAGRGLLSAGQVRTVAAALRLAALAEVEKERAEPLPAVLDDVDADLDAVGVEHLLEVLATERQLFLSTTHEDRAGRERPGTTLRMRAGSCTGTRAASGEVV